MAKHELPLVLSVTSGKGGVGKTNFSVNLACMLSQMNHKVILLDADLGLANVDILLGITPEKNIFHLLSGEADIAEILIKTDYGFSILPAASGVSEILSLSTGQKLELLESMDSLEDNVDFLIVDTAAGINDNVMYFNIAVQERIIVLTPEPTSLTDAYAMIKVLKREHGVENFRIVVNMAKNETTAKEVYAKIHKACDRFLDGASLDLLGYIPKDDSVRTAVIRQVPFSTMNTDSPASKKIKEVAENIASLEVADKLDGNIKFFWKKLLFQE